MNDMAIFPMNGYVNLYASRFMKLVKWW